VTEEQILKMKPGKELNMLVAKQVMGNEVVCDEIMGESERLIDESGDSVWSTPLLYSEDVLVAQEVVNQMAKRGYADAASWKDYGNGTYTPAEAICKQALLAVLKANQSCSD